MARDEFDNAGQYVSMADLLGQTLLITPTEYIEEFTTSFKTSDALMADIAVITADGVEDEHEDVMIFQGALIGTLKKRIKKTTRLDRDPVTGVVTTYEKATVKRVLGVLGKGEKKANQQAPYILTEASDELKAVAREYVKKNPVPDFPELVVKQEVMPGAALVMSDTGPAVTSFPAPAQAASDKSADTDPWAAGAEDGDPFAADNE